jgi:hypothetical protein
MTSNAQGGSGRILGSLRSADGKGAVRMQDHYDTDIDDLWSALTDPRRLARWIGEVEGICDSADSSAHTSSPADGKAPGAQKPANPRTAGWCGPRTRTARTSTPSRPR